MREISILTKYFFRNQKDEEESEKTVGIHF